MQVDWRGSSSPGNEGEEDEDPSSLFHLLGSIDGSIVKAASTEPLPLIGTPPPAYGGSATASPLLRRSSSGSGSRRRVDKNLLQSSYSACKARINDLKLLVKTAPKKHRFEIDSAIKVYKLISTMAYSTLIFSSINDLEVCIYKLSKGVGNQLVNMDEWSQVIEICKAEIRRKSESIVSFGIVVPGTTTTAGTVVEASIDRNVIIQQQDLKNEITNLKNDIDSLKKDAASEHEKIAINMENLRTQMTSLVKSEYSRASNQSPGKNSSAVEALKERNSRLEGEVTALNMRLTAFFKLKEESEGKLVEKYERLLAQGGGDMVFSSSSSSSEEARISREQLLQQEAEISKYKVLGVSLEEELLLLKSSSSADESARKGLAAEITNLNSRLEASSARESSLAAEASATKIRVSALEAELSILSNSGAISAEHTRLRADFERLQSQQEASRAESDAAKQQLSAASRRASELDAQVHSLEEECKHLKHTVVQLQVRVSDTNLAKQSNAETIDRLTLDLEISTKKAAALESSHHTASRKVELLIAENASLEHSLADLTIGRSEHHHLDELKKEIETLTRKNEHLSQEHFAIATKCSIISKENKELKFELEDMNGHRHAHIKQLQGERDTANKLKAVAEGEFLVLSAKLNFANKEYQENKRKLAEMTAEAVRLGSDNKALREQCDNQIQYAALMRDSTGTL